MTASGGYGMTLTFNGTAVVGVDSVDEILFSKFIAESTAHDSAGGYYEAVPTGKRRIEPFGMSIFWDINDGTHSDILDGFDADTSDQLSFADPDGDETIEFNAHVESIGRISEQEDAYRANVSIHPTGTATIT